MHLVFFSGTTAPNSLPIPFNPVLLHRPGTYKQLHRELLCGFDKTPRGTFYQHGRSHSKLESCHYSSIGRLTKDGLEKGVVSETRRMDSSCNAYGCSCDCALGDDCTRSTPEREGELSLPSDILRDAKFIHRERTNEKGEKYPTTSTSMHYSPHLNIPHVPSSHNVFIVLPTPRIIQVLPKP